MKTFIRLAITFFCLLFLSGCVAYAPAYPEYGPAPYAVQPTMTVPYGGYGYGYAPLVPRPYFGIGGGWGHGHFGHYRHH
jgi:hypothetical protein